MAPLSLIRKYSIQSSQNSKLFFEAGFYTSELKSLTLHNDVLIRKLALENSLLLLGTQGILSYTHMNFKKKDDCIPLGSEKTPVVPSTDNKQIIQFSVKVTLDDNFLIFSIELIDLSKFLLSIFVMHC